ncbi:hypothetical protein G8759_19830 [Spirosoma aureum]|uniref:Uncharacterized protein n=1 Tax=Spirosoma aureum TaxID=2692134 RepID=A0A6G9AQD8_9BACT|nr:hypothetical protein [Spirosoma aureum]QIP14701.1 hypothetical protein G8759_19830 [Spirosoma aureum]
MEYNFRESIEKLLEERRRTKKSLFEHLKMTGQGFDAMLKNNTISAIKLAQIAEFLEVPVSYFYGDGPSTTKNDIPKETFGDQIAKKMAEDIGELRHFFEEEIRTKNRQIDGLQRMLESVLGKSEGDTNQPTLGYEAVVENALLAMNRLGLSLVNAPYAFRTHIPLASK